jgi:hypothetical protein
MNRNNDFLVLLGAVIAADTLIRFWVPFRRGQEARKTQPVDGIPQAKTMEK